MVLFTVLHQHDKAENGWGGRVCGAGGGSGQAQRGSEGGEAVVSATWHNTTTSKDGLS